MSWPATNTHHQPHAGAGVAEVERRRRARPGRRRRGPAPPSARPTLLHRAARAPRSALAVLSTSSPSSRPVMRVRPVASAPSISARCEIDLSPGTRTRPRQRPGLQRGKGRRRRVRHGGGRWLDLGPLVGLDASTAKLRVIEQRVASLSTDRRSRYIDGQKMACNCPAPELVLTRQPARGKERHNSDSSRGLFHVHESRARHQAHVPESRMRLPVLRSQPRPDRLPDLRDGLRARAIPGRHSGRCAEWRGEGRAQAGQEACLCRGRASSPRTRRRPRATRRWPPSRARRSRPPADEDETFLEEEEEDGSDMSSIIGGPVAEPDEPQ